MASMLVKSKRTPIQRVGRVLRPRLGKRVKLFLIYVKDTLEADNAHRIRDMLSMSEYEL